MIYAISASLLVRQFLQGEVRIMVFKVTFNNISVISWRSVLLVEETGVPTEPPTCRNFFNTREVPVII